MRFAIVLLLASAVWGQQTPQAAPTPPQVLRVFEVKYADVNGMATLLNVFGAIVRPDTTLRVISVRGTTEQVQAIEDAIKRYDVTPPAQKNVELTFQLLLAGPSVGADKLPADLDPVIKQLRNTFPYQSYRLADTMQVRARHDDGFDVNSTPNFVALLPGAPPTPSTLRVQKVTISMSEKTAMLRLDNLRLSVRFPVCSNQQSNPCTQFNFIENAINTSIDIREGQKVVVGKTAIGSDSAIIVVVTAKVVD